MVSDLTHKQNPGKISNNHVGKNGISYPVKDGRKNEQEVDSTGDLLKINRSEFNSELTPFSSISHSVENSNQNSIQRKEQDDELLLEGEELSEAENVFTSSTKALRIDTENQKIPFQNMFTGSTTMPAGGVNIIQHTNNSIGSQPLQRQGLDIALAGVGIIHTQVTTQDGLTWNSDHATYPGTIPNNQVPAQHQQRSRTAAVFQDVGVFVDSNTEIVASGSFGDLNGSPFLANVKLEILTTTTYAGGAFGSTLSFFARAMQIAYGTPDNPKIRFQCTGRFDPYGRGDVTYNVEIDVDKFCQVEVVSRRVVAGIANIQDRSPDGFLIRFDGTTER